jgi:hypothetical protein
MSGIGKTALASQLFQNRRAQYEKASFLENVRSRHTEDVQRQLIYDLSGTVDWDKSKYGVKIRSCVNNLRCLVVIDDCASEDDLAALQLSAFRDEKAVKKKSKCVITSQDWQVMQEYVPTAARVQVGALDELDGMALFSHFAFEGAKVDKERQKLIHQLMVRDGRSHKHAEHHPNVEKLAREFEAVSTDIVQACAGNPLSLQTMGEFLGKKNKFFGTADLLDMYKEALFKLRHAQILGGGKCNDKLWTRFWGRYHDLDRPEREMFVEFACFICGGEESSATTNRLTVSRDAFIKHSKSGSPRISLQNLIDKSFVVVKPGGLLSMHNHFCDMGRKIARERVAKVGTSSAPAPNDDDG